MGFFRLFPNVADGGSDADVRGAVGAVVHGLVRVGIAVGAEEGEVHRGKAGVTLLVE